MTDKEQIMIHGVDVSECEFYVHSDYGKFPHGCSLHKDMFGLPVCCDVADCCKNCYFKQLARKTQECEQKEKELLSNEKIINKLMKEVDELKQECEELKEEISKLQLNEYHYKNKLKKYKKGIHKYRNLLKYEINDLRLSRREFLKTVKRYPKFEKDNIKLALDTFNKKLELIDNPNRYRKALKEIENFMNYEFSGQNEWVKTRILDIINKAKGR